MTRAISIETKAGRIEGVCDPKFDSVLKAFVENFETHGEVGASCALTLEGQTLVDLWGGKRAVDGPAWDKDTVSIVFSCTKGALALCAHICADRGLLDLDAPVSRYWPEFAQNGKEEARVSMLLDHSVGLPATRATLKQGAFYDYDHMVKLLEDEAPFWKPGTRNGYHAVTIAWLAGEMVRRASGKRTGVFFQEEVARPLGVDFWIGLPESEEHRVALMIPPVYDTSAPPNRLVKAALAEPGSPPWQFLFNLGGFDPNSRECRAAEIGSGNGITNARGLAGMYAPLANGKLVSRDTLMRMSRVAQATQEDATLMIPTRFALGFMKSMDNRHLDDAPDSSCILSEAAFGHVGMGGSIGFADPEARMSFGYSMNKMGLGILLNERGQGLVDAAYRALGYRSNKGGVWAA